MRRLSALAVFGILALACGGSTGGGTTKTGADIIIGEALAATGADAKEGALTKQGVDIWLDWEGCSESARAGRVDGPVCPGCVP